jgi:predicted nucleic acid-binding protein
MTGTTKRYYDACAIVNFYSQTYRQAYPDLFPDRAKIDYENYACAFAIEEANHAFLKQGGAQIDIDTINKYLHSYTVLKHGYFEAYRLYIQLFVDLFKLGKVRTQKKRPGDDKIDSKDIFVFSMAIINGIDQFVTFDSDFRILEEHMKKSPYLMGRKLKIVIEKTL